MTPDTKLPRDELGDTQWIFWRKTMGLFDPQEILNPGKVFTPLTVTIRSYRRV